ncbi:VOC family protein [Limimaricola pyoseonensis]|uniref:Catechol 2,3-dioxygenase n=1 Tax=Limimaricola pyoseonensis TaxID=521013 RepID=A0A1G7AD48_9RHOB|nr:VOC family protein [Limimaricola pyoseonensis]SDE12719.1 Catechol 2,3-dioxygenase [Limimaricola pyoseonensis]
MIFDLHHVQLAMPQGGEAAARGFYGDLLGLEEEAKPEALKERGGVWFRAPGLRLHLGVETPFVPARKAHPAFRVADLDAAVAGLEKAGVACRPDIDLPGLRRVYLADPFGNRIEICQAV